MVTKITEKEKKRLLDAAESLEEIQKRLAPYIKPRKILYPNTHGQWRITSNDDATLTRDGFETILKKVAPPIKKDDTEKK